MELFSCCCCCYLLYNDFSNRFSLSKFRVMISQLFSDDLSEHASVDCWKKQSTASIVQCGQLMITYQYSRVVNLDIVMVCLDSNILFRFFFLFIYFS